MAVSANPAAQESVQDSVRALQHALYRAAKADPGRRFHALGDKVYRRDVLERAWVAVRRNDGAPGIDAITEVFSPAIHAELKGVVDVAGQGCSKSSGTSITAPE